MTANDARELLAAIISDEVQHQYNVGKALRKIYDGQGDVRWLEEENNVPKDMPRREKFNWWCREYAHTHHRTAWRYIEYYDHRSVLPAPLKQLAESISPSRLLAMSRKSRSKHPDFPMLLEKESDPDTRLSGEDFEVECLKLEGKSETEAEDGARERRERAARHLAKKHLKERSQMNRHVWKSEKFRKWVRNQPCIFTGHVHQWTDSVGLLRVDPAHVYTKGSGGDDLANVVPVRADIHREQHDTSWDAVLEKYGRDWDFLFGEAERVLIDYLNHLEGKQ